MIANLYLANGSLLASFPFNYVNRHTEVILGPVREQVLVSMAKLLELLPVYVDIEQTLIGIAKLSVRRALDLE
jgi:hypothetical protein